MHSRLRHLLHVLISSMVFFSANDAAFAGPAASGGIVLADGTHPNDVDNWSQWKWLFVSKYTLTNGLDVSEDISSKKLTWYERIKDDKGAPGSFLPLTKGTDTGTRIESAIFPASDPASNDVQTVVAYTPGREFWSVGDKVMVVYVTAAPGGKCDLITDKPNINFTETSRKTAFQSELSQLVHLAPGGAPAGAQGPCFVVTPYTLQDTRATLDIKFAPKPTAAPGASTSSTITTTIITGPPEHAFFTTDVVVNNLSEVKFDSTSNSLTEKSVPNNPMIGINWMIGDPYKAYDDDLTTDRIAFKFLASASTPKDIYGAGIGYVAKDHLFDTKTAGAFMVFLAYIRTRGDNGVFTGNWRLGLSYNLNSLSSGK